MRGLGIIFLLVLLVTFHTVESVEAKKIKNSFKIEKESSKDKKQTEIRIEGKKVTIEANDSLSGSNGEYELLLNGITFSGYDKEVNSSKESFLVSNKSEVPVTGFEIRIDYLDMKGRMLHSREVKKSCLIPPGETRKVDIPAWETQHTYYYYLGNEPKRVATPFQVAITPKCYWIEE